MMYCTVAGVRTSFRGKGTKMRPKFSLSDSRLWHYRAIVTRVIDGDTVEVMADAGFGNYRTERLRLARVDAPEIRPRRGSPEQKEAERALANEAKERVIELVEGRECMIRTYKTGNFGRWIADIFLPASSPPRTINEVLIEERLAIPYGEKKPDNWEEYHNQTEAGEE